MRERANAKINLCLDVVGKRESDGYHELKMIMVPIDFYDVLEMLPAKETTLSLNRSYLPVNDKNTIIKAINVMKAKYGFDTNFACILHKHIPTRAGLAGGSADAAAAIRSGGVVGKRRSRGGGAGGLPTSQRARVHGCD